MNVSDGVIDAALDEIQLQQDRLCRYCPAVNAVDLALQRSQKCSAEQVAGTKRLMSKQPPIVCRGTMQGAGKKSRVRCSACNKIVRRDNLARHLLGSACTRAVKAPAKATHHAPSRSDSVSCEFCKREYIWTQRAIHLRTLVCREARARGNVSIDID